VKTGDVVSGRIPGDVWRGHHMWEMEKVGAEHSKPVQKMTIGLSAKERKGMTTRGRKNEENLEKGGGP